MKKHKHMKVIYSCFSFCTAKPFFFGWSEEDYENILVDLCTEI